jgi:hypothetical protein
MSISIRHTVKIFIITGFVVAIFLPGMPALAEETTVIDATNNSEQTAETSVPSTPPEEPVVVEPPVVVQDTVPPPVVEEPVVPVPDAPETPESNEQQPPNENQVVADDSEEFLAPLANQPDGVSTTTVENTLDSNATSGDATVHHNTTGGNATTGNADVIATIINMLQSSTSWTGGQLNTFIQNIDGDVLGDILLDPRVMSNANQVAKKPAESLEGSVNTDSRINNDINLSATSGNAGVHHNTVGGNATSGDANVLLNLINIINSWAVANQSFLGMINIYGNLNGDILIPEALLQQLLASNGSSQPTGDVELDTDTTMGITNNINLGAQSGAADVHHNSQAGNATTGNATTKMTILNLTNRQIIGSDAILVFVNVLGTWVGMIVNAPTGTTAAALGDITSDNGYGAYDNVDLDVSAKAQITNNINLSARSGDATVHHNSQAGDATSGDATTSLNLINIINSQLSFSNWFGILFINVFGSWTGSFGVNTAAGETPVAPPAPAASAPLVTFIPATTKLANKVSYNFSNIDIQAAEDNQQVMSVKIDNGNDVSAPAFSEVSNLPILMALGGLGCFIILGAVEKRHQKMKHYRMDNQFVWPSI